MNKQNPEEFAALSDEMLAEFLTNHAHREPIYAEPVMRPEWQVRIGSAVDMADLLESVMPLVLEWAATVAGQEVTPAVDWDEETGLTLGYLCGGCAEETEEVAR